MNFIKTAFRRFRLRRTRFISRQAEIGIGRQDDLVDNRAVLAHPDVQRVDATTGDLEGGADTIHGAVGPGVVKIPTMHAVAGVDFGTVEAGVIHVLRAM